MIEFLNLAKLNGRIRNELIDAASRVINSGLYIMGSELKLFEMEFSNYCGSTYSIGVGNGLDALDIILKAYIETGRLTDGGEVILPSNTFIATALAVINNGLKPVFIDPDPETYLINVDMVKDVITKKTQAIIPVHLYGRCCDMVSLRELCNTNGLLLIEDAAQAHGARFQNVMAGNLGDAAGFSFYPGKNLGALGDAGMITTNDTAIAEICRAISNYGSTGKYQNKYVGVNSRLDEIQAAFLRVKLRYYQHEITARRRIASVYCDKIKNPLVVLPEFVELEHVWHLFVIASDSRDKLASYLLENDIQTGIHYPKPIQSQEAMQHLGQASPFCVKLHDSILSLPISSLLSDEDIHHIITTINNWES